ncbi:MAG: class I adenylate-forming enzyme family protein [Hyphomicrobiaceae bacterium]
MDLGLAVDDENDLVAQGTARLSRKDVRARSEALVEVFKASGVSRAMVCSDNPLDIIRAIDACARSGVDLYIAHTTTPPRQLADIVASHAIQYRIGETDQQLAEARDVAPAQGRIHLMTSGTSGRPKIVAHTLASLASRAHATADHPANRMARWLLTYQPTGFAGLQVILTATLTKGMVVAPAERHPRGFYDAALRWGVTQISGTPTFWRAFLMAGNMAALSLRQITMGGEAADQATLDRVKAAFPHARITHTYASTEAGVVFAVHDGLEGFPAAYLQQSAHGIALRIRDGFLEIRTPNRMQGYVSENAQPVLEDGWLATTDRCEIVGDRVYILGRDDKTINVGGYKVYPLAIEKLILGQPGVAEARVYGVANPISGALVAADVVLSPGEDPPAARARILAACREQLASFQVPRVLKIVSAIATGASGKKA